MFKHKNKVLWKYFDSLLIPFLFERKVLKKDRVRKKCIVWMLLKNKELEFYYEFGTPSLFFHGYNKNGEYVEKEFNNEKEVTDFLEVLGKEF